MPESLKFPSALALWFFLSRCLAAGPAYGSYPPPAVGQHPRVVITPSELPMLRQRIQQGPAAKYYQAAIQNASKLLDPNSPASAGEAQLNAGGTPSEDAIVVFTAALQDAAFVGMVDSRRRDIIAAAIAALHTIVTRVPATADEFKKLSPERLVMQTGLAYDYLYGELDDGSRQSTRRWLTQALTVMAASLANADYGFAPNGPRNYNWTPFIVGSFGVAALSIEGEPGYQQAWYRNAASAFHDFLDRGIHASGSPWEACVMYLAYGLSQGTYFLDAMGRRGEPVWTNSHLLRAPRWWTYDLMPWGKQFNALSDARDTNLGMAEIYFRLALADSSPAMRWVYKNVLEAPNSTPYAQSSGALWATPPDDSITAESLKLPLTGSFPESSLVYMRSGWGPQDLYLEFQSANEYAGPSHAHSDRNSFTFMALGRMWAIDSGYHVAWGTEHNLVQIDDKSEGYCPQRGRILQQVEVLEDWSSSVVGDAKAAYDWAVPVHPPAGSRVIEGLPSVPFNPVDYAYRSATLVRGSHPYAMITDAILKNDGRSHRYVWQMMTPPGNAFDNAGAGRLIVKPASAGEKLLRSKAGAQPLSGSFKVMEGGNYRFYLMAGHDYSAAWYSGIGISIDQEPPVRAVMDNGERSRTHWQPLKAGGKPLLKNLQAGSTHTVRITADNDQISIGTLLVAPDGYDPTAVRSMRGAASPPPGTVQVTFGTSSPNAPAGWETVTANPREPRLLLQVISPRGAVATDAAFYQRRDAQGKPSPDAPAMRMTATIDSAQDPQFRVILCPYTADEQPPQVTVDSPTSLRISWPDKTVDTWTFGSGARSPGLANVTVHVQRRLPSGAAEELATAPQP